MAKRLSVMLGASETMRFAAERSETVRCKSSTTESCARAVEAVNNSERQMLDRADKRMDNRKLCYENIGGMGARSKTDAEMNIDFPFFFGEIAALKSVSWE